MTSLRSVLSRALAVALLATVAGAIAPSAATAQKALVYCPASIDVAGCDNAITALGTDFPGGVDRGYDGSSGTMDMRTIDLWSYAVIVIPSLADGSGGLPYAFLRDTAVSGKLHAAIMGRIALWSGTPDQGTANRAAKNALLQSLARWAQGNYATVKGPGLVALQDLSDTVSHRYDWLHAITGLTVTADSAVYTYASVGAVTATGTAILTDATGATIAYANMASLGFFLPQGAAGLHLDAVGQTGTSQGGQVVLATSPGGNTGTAVIATDKDDYAPGTTVTITGHGFQPGETVTISLLESPNLDQHPAMTSVADANGNFVNTSFSPDAHDVGVRFLVTAVGGSSGMQAEATFTDAVSVNNNGVAVGAQNPSPVTAGGSATFAVSVTFKGNNSTCTVGLSVISGLPAGATASFSPTTLSATTATVLNSTLTVATTGATPGGTSTLTIEARGTGGTNNSCGTTDTQSQTASFAVNSVLATTLSVGATSPASITYSTSAQAVTLSATVAASAGVNGGTVTFTVKDGSNATVGSAVTSGAVSGGSATASYSLPANTPVGSYTVNAQYSGTSGFGSSSGTGSLAVGKAAQAAVTLTGVPTTAQPYQGTFTIGASGGSGTGAYSFASTGVCSVNATTGLVTMTSGTGTCSLTATRAGDANYNVSSPSAASAVSATLALQAALNVTGMPATAQTFGVQFTVGATGGSGSGSVSFASTGACSVNASSGLVTITSGTGTCSVTASKAGDSNYAPITSSAATVSAAKATQVITWTAPAPITYGTSLAGVLNASITTGDGTLSYDHASSEVPTPGSLTITATASATANYNGATAQVTLTVNKATLTPNVTAQNKVYDGTTAAQASGTLVGVVGSDVVTLAIGSATFADRNVGTGKTVTFTGLTLSGAQSGFYLLSTTSATATADITRAPLTITASSPASIVYGSPAPSVTPSFSAFATGDDASVVTGLACGTTYVAGNDVGSYATTCSGGTAANYSLGYMPGSFSVTKAPLSVTAANASREYGDANPSFTGTLSGVVNNDAITATYGSSADPTSNVGTYAITPSLNDPGSRLGNYSVTSTNGTLTITAAPLIVTPADAQRLYGGTDPAFTGAVTGIKNNDPITATYATTASASSPVGAYDITATLADPSSRLGNYAVTLNKGTLKIVPAPLTVKADDATRLYGAADPAFTASYTGFVLSETPSVLGGALAFATPATAASDVGTYKITPSGVTSSNYTITFSDGTLTVTPAPLTIAAANATRTYGAQNPTFTGTITGLKNSDAITATYASTANQQSHVGTYAITPTAVDQSPAKLGNYTVTLTNGTLTISQASPIITWAQPASIPQGTALSATQLNATATGVFNEAVTGSFAYTPPSGTTLYTVGATALSTTFTSTNTDYTGATKNNSIDVTNVAPTVTSITLGSAPVPINQSVGIQAAFSDPGINDTWTAQITWDDGTTSAGTVSNGTVSASHTFTTAGVYTITVAVTDNNGGTGTRASSSDLVGYVVVYDPSAGFVTGGGWISSPSGACRLTTVCGTATGKANFGFNARYQKGANVPDGTTEFQFQAGGLNFHSTVYQWLVVSGTKAQYKGSGTVNGVGGYGFLLTAIDGTQKGNPDAFRIKITDSGGNVVYDNQMGSLDDSSDATTLGGGSIVIH